MKYILPLILALSVFIFVSCSATKAIVEDGKNIKVNAFDAPKALDGMLIHNVYFWYVDGADQNEIANFERELQTLGTISSIGKYYYGPPAGTAVRGPVDNSYDIAINVFFKDLAAHDAYQIDPIHLAFIEKCKHLWEKVVVYDNEIK